MLRGAGAFLLIAAPCGVLIAVLHGPHLSNARETLLAVAVVLLVLVAPVVGGATASAAAGERAPLTQAAVAVGVPTALFVVIRVIDGIIRGTIDGALVTTLVLYLLILTGLAVLGSYVTFRRRSSRA